MPAKRSLTLALALLLVAAIPARGASFPAITVVDTIRPGVDGSGALWGKGRLGDYLYFGADDGVNGYELWRTNGTSTNRVADINLAVGAGSNPNGFTALNDWLYFQAADATEGNELWRTNGTTTELFADINSTGGTGSSDPAEFTVVGDWLYFSATQGDADRELWRTNGTNTSRVSDIWPEANGSSPSGLTAVGDYLYFIADDGTHGLELWRTNGTEAGTTLVKDIRAGFQSDWSLPFAAFRGYLYFSVDDGTHGYELWRTDGTTTQLVENINTANGGVNDSDPYGFTALNGYLYFNAYESTHGAEIWRTNGTTTALVEDISTGNGGADSSNPNYLTVLGDWLYFVATDGTRGYELWRIDDEGTTSSVAVPGTSAGVGCMCARPLSAMDGRLFIAMYSDETGSEFAYLDEPAFGLPETSTAGSSWSTTLVLLAAVTAVAGVGLTARMREAKRR